MSSSLSHTKQALLFWWKMKMDKLWSAEVSHQAVCRQFNRLIFVETSWHEFFIWTPRRSYTWTKHWVELVFEEKTCTTGVVMFTKLMENSIKRDFEGLGTLLHGLLTSACPRLCIIDPEWWWVLGGREMVHALSYQSYFLMEVISSVRVSGIIYYYYC